MNLIALIPPLSLNKHKRKYTYNPLLASSVPPSSLQFNIDMVFMIAIYSFLFLFYCFNWAF